MRNTPTPEQVITFYLVIDDYGDEWESGNAIYSADSLEDAERWAEGENFHSASIVLEENGIRTQKLN